MEDRFMLFAIGRDVLEFHNQIIITEEHKYADPLWH